MKKSLMIEFFEISLSTILTVEAHSVTPRFFRFVQFFFGFKIRYTPFSSEFTQTAQTIRFVKILNITTESIFQVLFRYYK